MTTFDPPLRGDALTEYMPQIKAGDTVSVEVTCYDRVSAITGPCWEVEGVLFFALSELLRRKNGGPAAYVTALLAHEPTVVLPTGLHAVVRLTGRPGDGDEADRQWTASRGDTMSPWVFYRDGVSRATASDEQVATVYAETLYEGIEVAS